MENLKSKKKATTIKEYLSKQRLQDLKIKEPVINVQMKEIEEKVCKTEADVVKDGTRNTVMSRTIVMPSVMKEDSNKIPD